MITYKTGDLLQDDAEALVSTVNTVGVMGKGIALAFKKAFPANYLQYRYACQKKTFNSGQILVVRDTNLLYGEKLVINFPTKTHWSFNSEYAYIDIGLIALTSFMESNNIKTLAIPALGCDIEGLDWQRVKYMIEDHLRYLACDTRVYKPVF